MEAAHKEVIIMAQERKFVQENIKRSQIENYIAQEFSRAGYSHSDITRTALATRITIWAHKPGIIIGRGGKNIDIIVQRLKDQFVVENPQLDIQEVREPDLDPHIVAREIASAIERGFNYKRISHLMMERVMDAGAIGVAMRISGKISGELSRTEKFSSGYLKFAGEPADTYVQKGYANAQVKLGTIGIQVRIMTQASPEMEATRKLTAKVEGDAAAAEAKRSEQEKQLIEAVEKDIEVEPGV
jgi:small subunit ribosomal protein S3